jgi:hypothetical protein
MWYVVCAVKDLPPVPPAPRLLPPRSAVPRPARVPRQAGGSGHARRVQQGRIAVVGATAAPGEAGARQGGSGEADTHANPVAQVGGGKGRVMR